MTDPEYLLDSNILVCLLGGHSQEARARVEGHSADSLATSAVAFAEIMLGARTRDAEREAGRLFAHLQVLPFDAEAARVYAAMPTEWARFDRLIAAQALARGLTLVTDNERDFADIPGLKIENWTL